MPRALWLADALRAEGVTVEEYPGWRERGSATFNPKGVIAHHTTGMAMSDTPRNVWDHKAIGTAPASTTR